MRILPILLIFIVSSTFAQEETGVLGKVKEFVIGTECEQHLRSSERYSNTSIWAADAKEWDYAFRNDEMAFAAIIMARSACEDEPENLKKAEGYLEDHFAISERLVCSYHASEAVRFTGLAKEASKQSDIEDTLFNSRWATYYLDEAIVRCAYSPERVVMLTNIRDRMAIQIDKLEKL
jgi:hypothetical protein